MTGSPGTKPVAPGPYRVDPAGVLMAEGERERGRHLSGGDLNRCRSEWHAHWFLRRRARRRAVKRSFPASVGRELRRRILVALELLDWLDGNTITLDQLQQDDLDRWLNEQNTQHRHLVHYFLKWTHQRGLSRKLVVSNISRQQPAKLLDDDERWRLLQRCLTDTTLPVDIRAAGALTLLFGLPTERIRHLTADQLRCQGNTLT